ncbi:hypothetical protein BRAS3843_1260013 [Bradyrhizobium sp. STM 3843]|nr:hypothetical protein BRAS3843_1260013 [Bradyrhizobium sp. STM 3843]
MITRLMRLVWWIGHSGTSAVIAAQFGLAMMPLWSRMRLALISGITNGTFGSMRKAEELSTTTAPERTAIGANFFEMPLPAENRAMSTPSNERSFSSSMVIVWPRKLSVLPAERALASAFSRPTRTLRRSMVAMNSAPTAPVTPTMATTGSFFTSLSPVGIQAIKKPRTWHQAGLRFEDVAARFVYARTPPEARQGLVVFVVRLVAVNMARDHRGGRNRRQRAL